MKSKLSIFPLALFFVSAASVATAQNLPERGEVRRGNSAYEDEDYATAAEHYARAMGYAPESFAAKYNLGSALFKREKFSEAEGLLKALAADSLRTSKDRAEAYYNLGNAQFQQKKLEEALESYKESLRQDPSDMETKYNYIYTKALLESQQQNEDQKQDQQDQDKKDQDQNKDQQDQNKDQQDQNQDQDQQQNEENQDQNQEQQDQQDQKQNEDQQDQQQGEQPQDGRVSDEQQQQMLDAIQAQEDKTQDKLEEKARGAVMQGTKNW